MKSAQILKRLQTAKLVYESPTCLQLVYLIYFLTNNVKL